jgi:hypothetical protein
VTTPTKPLEPTAKASEFDDLMNHIRQGDSAPFIEFMERARKGDKSTVPTLKKILQQPNAVESLGGNLAKKAEAAFITTAAGEDLVFSEALTTKMELLRAELAGPKPTPIERLLVERAVACWLQVQDADVRYAQAKDLSVKWYEYFQSRMNHSHKRYLSALKTLALVRKLAVPVLQVNIAKKQINVAGPVIGKSE